MNVVLEPGRCANWSNTLPVLGVETQRGWVTSLCHKQVIVKDLESSIFPEICSAPSPCLAWAQTHVARHQLDQASTADGSLFLCSLFWPAGISFKCHTCVEQGFEKVPRLQRGSESSLVILAFVPDQRGRWEECANPDQGSLG